MLMRCVRLLGAVAAFAVISAPLPGRGADTAPFEIDTILPLTGPGAFVGQRTAKAFAAIAAYVNKNGGIRGRPITFAIADDQTNPQISVQIMSQYLAKKPAIVIGGMFASTCLSAAALVKDTGPVMYCFSPAVHPAAGSWVFSDGFVSTDLYASAMRYFRAKGLIKIGLLTTTDASGQDADNGVDEVLKRPENSSITITAKEHFSPTDISVSAQLERIRASGAQAMIAWAAGTPFVTVLRGLRDAGIQMPVYTAQANVVYAQLESYKNIWPTMTPVIMGGIPSIVPDAITDRGVRRSIDQYDAAMRAAGIDRPDVGVAVAWDVSQIVVEAYRHLGTDATPLELRDYINAIRDWPGIFGRLDFKASPQRGAQGEWVNILRWDPETASFSAVSKPGGAPL